MKIELVLFKWGMAVFVKSETDFYRIVSLPPI